MVTTKEEGWTLLSLMMDNSEALVDLCKYHMGQLGLDSIINSPTKGTCAVEASPRVVTGIEYCHINLNDTINILTEPHKLTLDQVRSYSAWFTGDETSTLTVPPTPTNMIIKVVDPNIVCNPGLINQCKILLRQYSGMLNMILKNHLQRTSFASLNPKSTIYQYKDEVSGRRIVCGLVKLKLTIEIIIPQIMVDHEIKEQDLDCTKHDLNC